MDVFRSALPRGERLGTTKKRFTIEQNYPDLDMSERFDDAMISGCSIRIPPNGIISTSWMVMARNGTILKDASAPYFTSPSAATTTDVLTGIEGGLRLGGVEQTIVTGVDFSIAGNLSAQPVVGTPLLPDFFPGRLVATGNVSFYLDDDALLSAFYNEAELDLVVNCTASGSAPQDFMCFNFQRIKLGAAGKQAGADGGMIVSAPFQALLKTGGSGTAFDQSTLSIQRSNA